LINEVNTRKGFDEQNLEKEKEKYSLERRRCNLSEINKRKIVYKLKVDNIKMNLEKAANSIHWIISFAR
jgi:hypothetical protein